MRVNSLFKTIPMLMGLLFISSGAFADYPVRWTPDVKVKELKDVDVMLDKPADLSQAGDSVTFTLTKDGKQVDAIKFTCREYFKHIEDDFAPLTNYDISSAGWVEKYCVPLRFLKQSKPAKISFLEDFDITHEPLNSLPISLGVYLSGDTEIPADEAAAKGLTWKEFAPQKVATIEGPYSVQLKDEDDFVIVDLMAWGDFNGDGYQDILLSNSKYLTGGTYHEYMHLVFTRLEKGGKLIQVTDNLIPLNAEAVASRERAEARKAEKHITFLDFDGDFSNEIIIESKHQAGLGHYIEEMRIFKDEYPNLELVFQTRTIDEYFLDAYHYKIVSEVKFSEPAVYSGWRDITVTSKKIYFKDNENKVISKEEGLGAKVFKWSGAAFVPTEISRA